MAGTTDTAAEMFGSGLLSPGQGMIKLASVGRLAVVSRSPVVCEGVINYRHVIDGLWYPGGGTKSAATVPRWLRDNMWHSLSFGELDAAAERVPAGSGGLLFQPHLLGEWSPYYDERLRGNYLGVTMRHTKDHFIRAALEGVCFALRCAIEHLAQSGITYTSCRLIGGGTKSRVWARILSDVLDREIEIPRQQDAVYGAALITAVSAGFFDFSRIEELIAVERTVTPNPENRKKYEDLYGLYLESDRLLAGMSRRLTRYEERYGVW